MALSISEVEQVARLARLELTLEEKEHFTEQLNSILQYVEKLKELPTDGVEPTAHAIPLKNVFREDKPRPSMAREAALANAPDREGEFFRVPQILEGDN